MRQEDNGTKIYSLNNLLEKYARIIIPNIQRDYVLGSNDKYLRDLLNDMTELKGDIFDFSCIIGHSEDNKFYVYDGQQRIVTLIFMIANRIGKRKSFNDSEKEIKEIAYIEMLIRKFQFEERDDDNIFLDKVLKDEAIDEVYNLTTKSLKKMISNDNKINELSINFLLNNIKFKFIEIEKREISEQLFLDLNEGVILEEYEIFKSKLDYQINQLCRNSVKYNNINSSDYISLNDLKNEWRNKLDNRWLEWFYENFYEKIESKFKYHNIDVSVNIEFLEMRFVLYCLKMSYIEKNSKCLGEKEVDILKKELEYLDKFETIDIKWLEENFSVDIFQRIYEMMEKVTLFEYKNKSEENFYVEVGNQDKIGSTKYLNLNFDNYQESVFDLIYNWRNGNYYENGNWKIKGEEWNVSEEVITWVYLNCFDEENEIKNEYLRMVKKIFNQNRKLNKRCYYYTEKKDENDGQNYRDCVNYARMHVIGVDSTDIYNEIIFDILNFNKRMNESLNNILLEKLQYKEISTYEKISIILDNYINYKKTEQDTLFIKMATEELRKYRSYNNCMDIIKYENDTRFNGIIHNVVETKEDEYKVIIPYKDFKESFKKLEAQKLIGKLQLMSEKKLFHDVVCEWKTYRVDKWKTPYREITDILTCTDKETRQVLKQYVKNNCKVVLPEDFLLDNKTWIANAFSGCKDRNNSGRGLREQMYYIENNIVNIVRPEHRSSSDKQYIYVDQTADLNSSTISKNINCSFDGFGQDVLIMFFEKYIKIEENKNACNCLKNIISSSNKDSVKNSWNKFGEKYFSFSDNNDVLKMLWSALYKNSERGEGRNFSKSYNLCSKIEIIFDKDGCYAIKDKSYWYYVWKEGNSLKLEKWENNRWNEIC